MKNNFFQNQLKSSKERFLEIRDICFRERQFAMFVPGLTVVLLGLAVLLMPRLFIALIATLFVAVGILLCFVAWRFVQLKRKFDHLRKDFQGRIVVHGVQVMDPQQSEDPDDSKKIIYH